MTTLADYQQELDGQVVLGTGTVYTVERLDGLGLPGLRTQDGVLPWDEGEIPGVDRLEGRDITWEGGVAVPGDPGGALDAVSLLHEAFDNVAVRGTPNAVVALRIKMPGRPVRVVYGRPRRFDYDDSRLAVGWVPYTAVFRAHDPRYYSEDSTTVVLGIDVSSSVGLVAPLVAPLVTTAVAPAARPGFFTIDGSAPTWPVLRIVGPCADPVVTNVGTGQHLGLHISLPAGDYVDIDTRPWARTVLRNGLGSAAGALTRGSRLNRFAIEPGTTEFRFNAVDPTTTSRLVITAQAAWRSL